MRLGIKTASRSSGSRHRHHNRRLLFLLFLLVPLLSGSFVAPAGPVAGDDLSDAQARQKALARQIAEQKQQIAELAALQGEVKSQISRTSDTLASVNANLDQVRTQVATMIVRVNDVRIKYNDLVNDLKALDSQLLLTQIQEVVKRQELVQRKALLASRLRDAYDTDRTSLLETFLSGDSFTDMLSQVSYYLDIGEQDRQLAELIIKDQETLQAIHENLQATRTATDELRLKTVEQKRELDSQLGKLRRAQAALKVLEHKVALALAAEKREYATLARNKAALRAAMVRSAKAERALASKIDKIIRDQAAKGRIPSQYNGTLHWPMPGTVSQEFGCTGFSWEPPFGDCAHFHQGIDIVAPYGTPVKSSGAGVVAYCNWNYADGADPAWIVIVAHSTSLETWYAHLIGPGGSRPACPVPAGHAVRAGQIIGYEGSTGHSTGAHLHWAVRLNDVFRNPRLFL
ncbi:MAG: murein hydrolase activator EnvC family protein [Chloroflexota bacterium]